VYSDTVNLVARPEDASTELGLSRQPLEAGRIRKLHQHLCRLFSGFIQLKHESKCAKTHEFLSILQLMAEGLMKIEGTCSTGATKRKTIKCCSAPAHLVPRLINRGVQNVKQLFHHLNDTLGLELKTSSLRCTPCKTLTGSCCRKASMTFLA